MVVRVGPLRLSGRRIKERINQTKHDNLIRASSKYRSVGAIAIKKESS